MFSEDDIGRLNEMREKYGFRWNSLGVIHQKEEEFARWVSGEEGISRVHVDVVQEYILQAVFEAVFAFTEIPDLSRKDVFVGLTAWYLAHLQKLRSAEILFRSGYGMVAASLLRDIREWTFLVAALQVGVVAWEDVHGPEFGTFRMNDADAERKRRDATLGAQRAARRWAIGQVGNRPRHGLLSDWDRYPNFETHGSMLTATFEIDAWKNGGSEPLWPRKDELSQRMYYWASLEACHLFVRLVPILQVQTPLAAEFVERWHAIDAIITNQWLAEPMRAPHLPGFVEMLKEAFSFTPEATRLAIVSAS